MIVTKELEAEVKKYYKERFDVDVRSVQDGAEGVFRGNLGRVDGISDMLF